jgi:glucosylceramidase
MRRVYDTLHARFPDKQILCTELSGWGKQRGPWFGDIEWAMAHNWLGGPQNWCEASVQWNLVLDWRFGPTLRGDSEATAAVAVNTDTYREARFEREFYAMAQMSRAARPGSKWIAASIRGNAPGLDAIAFALPDGRTSLVAFNKSTQTRAIQVSCGGRWFDYALPSRSIVTFVW